MFVASVKSKPPFRADGPFFDNSLNLVYLLAKEIPKIKYCLFITTRVRNINIKYPVCRKNNI